MKKILKAIGLLCLALSVFVLIVASILLGTEVYAYVRADSQYAEKMAVDEFARYILIWKIKPSNFNHPKLLCQNNKKNYHFVFEQPDGMSNYYVKISFLPVDSHVDIGYPPDKC